MREISEATRKKLEALRRTYAEQLPARVGAMEDLWIKIQHMNGCKDLLNDLIRQAHGLAGSGATYGFTIVSQTARELELLVEEVVETDNNLNESQARKAEILLASLKEACISAAHSPGNNNR